MKEFYKIIYVVLVYRNTKDIVDFIKSVKNQSNKKIVIVNSYFDERTLHTFENIAKSYDCDFVNVENLGYSYGNNEGIKYVNEYYDYDFLVISNPDIIVNKINMESLYRYQNSIIGTVIKSKNGTNQNPYIVKNFNIYDKYYYKGFKDSKKLYIYLASIIMKAHRELRMFFNKVRPNEIVDVYALHGSFLIFPKKILDSLGLPFDDNMFLFNEELVLAKKAKAKNINSKICMDCKVSHKEDGSMNLSDVNIYEQNRKSYLYYYNKYFL